METSTYKETDTYAQYSNEYSEEYSYEEIEVTNYYSSKYFIDEE